MSFDHQLHALLGQLAVQVQEERGGLRITDAEGRRSSLYANGDQAAITSGQRQLRYTLGPKGEVLAVESSGGRWECAYDGERRLTSLRFDTRAGFEWQYSGGRPHKILFGDGSCLRLAYDRAGILIYVQDRNGVDHGLSTTPRGGLQRLTDGAGHVTTLLPDLSSPRLVVRADGSSVCYTASAEGHLTQKLINGRVVASYETEESGRVIAVRFPGGEEQRYEHEGARLKAAHNSACTLRLSYDEQGALAEESLALAGQTGEAAHTRYEINPLGELAVIEYSGDRRQVFGRDDQGRVIEVFDSLGQSYHLTYDEAGYLEAIGFPNGMRTRWTYTPRGNVATIQTQGAPDAPPLLAQRYTYDDQDRLVEQEIAGETTTYRYDSVGRLSAVALSPEGDDPLRRGAGDLALDRQGNPASIAGEDASYDELGRLLRWGARQFRYDARGNLIFRRSPEHWTLMRYTAAGHLAEVTSPRGRVSFGYDALGRRILKQSRAGTTRYLWAGLMLLGEVFTDTAGKQIQREFIRLPGSQVPLALRINSQLYGLHIDRLGAPLCATDRAGQIQWRASYTPWGEAIVSEAKIEQPLRRPGQSFDMETALHYNLFRYYDPRLGRYLSGACMGAPLHDSSTYLYGDGDPINHLDPWLVQHFRPPGSPCALGGLLADNASRLRARLTPDLNRLEAHANLSSIWSGMAPRSSVNIADDAAADRLAPRRRVALPSPPDAEESAVAAIGSLGRPAAAASETPRVPEAAADPLAHPALAHTIWGGRSPARGHDLLARALDGLELPTKLRPPLQQTPAAADQDEEERAIALALGQDQARGFAETNRIEGNEPIADGFNDSGRFRLEDPAHAPVAPVVDLPPREVILVDRARDLRLTAHLEYAAALQATPPPARLGQLAAYMRQLITPLPELCAQLEAHHLRTSELFEDHDPGGVCSDDTAAQALAGQQVLLGDAPERLVRGTSRHAALLFKILGDEAQLDTALIRGKLQGKPHSWNEVTLPDGPTLLVDLMLSVGNLPFPEASSRTNYLYTDLDGVPLY